MDRTPLVGACLALLVLIPQDTARANDFASACRYFAEADAVFIGRAQPPVKRRISGEAEIEKARLKWLEAKAELERFRALKQHPSIAWKRDLDLYLQSLQAQTDYDTAAGMYPPPMDLLLTPMHIEVALRGVSTPEVLVWMNDRVPLEPGRSYLFYGQRYVLGPAAPDVLSPRGVVRDAEVAEEELRFLNLMATDNRGAVVYGSLRLQDGTDANHHVAMAGVPLRMSTNGELIDITTGHDGSFMIAGVAPGTLLLEPQLAAERGLHFRVIRVP